MSVYNGIDGVVREVNYTDVGRYGVRHAPEGWVGIDGVVRQFHDVLEDIDHVEFAVTSANVDEVDGNAGFVSSIGHDMAAINSCGSLTIGSNYINVSCWLAKRYITVSITPYIVFKDGHQATLTSLVSTGPKIHFILNAGWYESFGGDGWYSNYCLGVALREGYVSGSASGSQVIEDSANSSTWLSAGLNYGSTATSQQTYNSIIVDGTTIPITVTNRLT